MENQITSRKSVPHYLFVIPSLVTVILFYIWLASTGSEDQHGTTTHYYADLAGAFLNGKLSLPTKPDPRLLAAENPYNLQTRIELVRSGVEIPVDFSLYHGKYYMYWGPVPALFLIILQVFSRQPVGDFFLAFFFGMGIFLTQTSILLAIYDRYFSALPRWTLHLSILVVGLAWPVTLLRHSDDHARIYEAAIAGGQFFLLAGFLIAFHAIGSSPISNGKLVWIGLFWVMAIGSRHTLAAPILAMGVLTVYWLIRSDASFAAKAANLLSLGLPLALGGAILGWYNWARFDSIMETGFSYALTGVDVQKHSAELFSGSYILPNVYNYLFHPPLVMAQFPFVSMLKGSENPVFPFYTVPSFYYAPPMTGLLYIFPFGVFAIVPLIVLLSKLFKKHSPGNGLRSHSDLTLTWTVLNLGSSFLIAFFLIMMFFGAGMRYMGDFILLLTVLSALGFWQGYQFLWHKPFARSLYALTGAILGCISLFLSTLLAISTNSALTDLILHRFPFLK